MRNKGLSRRETLFKNFSQFVCSCVTASSKIRLMMNLQGRETRTYRNSTSLFPKERHPACPGAFSSLQGGDSILALQAETPWRSAAFGERIPTAAARPRNDREGRPCGEGLAGDRGSPLRPLPACSIYTVGAILDRPAVCGADALERWAKRRPASHAGRRGCRPLRGGSCTAAVGSAVPSAPRRRKPHKMPLTRGATRRSPPTRRGREKISRTYWKSWGSCAIMGKV